MRWASTHGVKPEDEWLLTQMKASTEMHRDILGAEKVSSEQWARVMDRYESVYNHAKQDTQPVEPVAAIEDKPEEPVNFVKKSFPKHNYTPGGKSICDFCHKAGHIRKNCPRRRNKKRFNRFVYTIGTDQCTPLIITPKICGQEINAMLDCGAMENVIDDHKVTVNLEPSSTETAEGEDPDPKPYTH